MGMVEWLVAAVIVVGVGVVVFGLVTGRLDRHAQGCCPADPSQDLRMRSAAAPGPAAPSERATP